MEKKIKIAVVATFRKFDPGYALAVGWLERVKMLKYFNQDFDLFVQSNCQDTVYPNMKPLLPHPDTKLPFNERVSIFEKFFNNTLQDYDVILTADLIYQRKGNFLAINQAMRNAQPNLKAHWYHWVHSAFTNRTHVPYPENLRFKMMEGSTLVYMNKSEMSGLAKQYNTDISNIACVYNPKDYRSFNGFTEDSWAISKILNLPDKDIVQVFPHCSTRMDAKGIDPVIRTFASLKRKGAKVGLIFANSHAKTMKVHLNAKKKQLGNLGLVDKKDYLFTSDLMQEKYEDFRALDRKSVSDLFKISNVFVFGSWREVCPNVVLEAKISGNLIIMNKQLGCGEEFGGEGYAISSDVPKDESGTIYFKDTAKKPGVQDGPGDMMPRTNSLAYYDLLAEEIIKKAPSLKHQWEYSYERIWHTQMKPLLYGDENEIQNTDNSTVG